MSDTAPVFVWHEAAIPLPPYSGWIKGSPIPWVRIPAFTLRPRKVILISGASGVGKSYFMGRLANVSAPPGALAGTGHDKYLANMPRPSGPSVWIPQHQELRLAQSVRNEAVSTWVSLGILNHTEAERRFESLADRIHLDKSKWDSPVGSLSGGEKKRFGLLLRLPIPAPLIYLDEPEAGLDRETFSGVLRNLLETETGEHEAPCVLIVSHEPDAVKTGTRSAGWEFESVELNRLPDNTVANPPYPSGTEPPATAPTPAAQGAARLPDWFSRITAQANNTFATEFKSAGTWIMHLGVPVIMLLMIGACQGGAAAPHWAKTIFFILITALWIGVQGGIFLFNRHLAAWREDESWAALAGPRANSIVRHFTRGTGVGMALFIPGFTAACILTLSAAAIFTRRAAPENTWVGLTQPLQGVALASASTLAYGYLLGLTLAATLAWIQLDRMGRRHEPSWSHIGAPALMIFHMLFSGTYIDGATNLSLDAASPATHAALHNPAVYAAAFVERAANLSLDPIPPLTLGRLWPLILLPLLALTSYRTLRAKHVRG